MKWVRDRTGRFERRPYYYQQEIDVQCEEVLASYWKDRGKSPTFPISTDDLTVLIRNHELNPDASNGPFGRKNGLFEGVDSSKVFDDGRGKTPGLGGTTTVVYDTRRQQVVRQFLSL